jgi:hypothetical protein
MPDLRQALQSLLALYGLASPTHGRRPTPINIDRPAPRRIQAIFRP